MAGGPAFTTSLAFHVTALAAVVLTPLFGPEPFPDVERPTPPLQLWPAPSSVVHADSRPAWRRAHSEAPRRAAASLPVVLPEPAVVPSVSREPGLPGDSQGPGASSGVGTEAGSDPGGGGDGDQSDANDGTQSKPWVAGATRRRASTRSRSPCS